MEKKKSVILRLTVISAGIAILLGFAAPASATTFCVPGFHSGCADNGTNVAENDIAVAVSQDGSDGVPDQVLIGDFTAVVPVTLEPSGTDHLEIVGNGTASSVITSSLVGGNNFVVNLDAFNRSADMSNLTIVIPASFADNLGGGLQAEDSTLDHVNIESRNVGSDGAPSLIGDTIWRDGRIFGAGGGSIGFGIQTNDGKPGSLEVIRTTIEDSVWGVVVNGPGVPVTLRGVRISRPVGYGARVTDGGRLTVENSIFEVGGQQAISVETDNTGPDADIAVGVRNSTFIAGADPDKPAIEMEIGGGFGSQNATVTVADSILQGFNETWNLIAPAGPGIGVASLTFTDSNFNPSGLPEDSPVVETGDPGNINTDPKFVGKSDYRLQPGSPSIDAGDPAPGGPPEDFDGTIRPLDGDGDGIRVRDQGAFEAAEIPTCPTDPSLCPKPPVDNIKPKIGKVRFKAAKRKKAGFLKFTLSEAAAVKATFKPTPAGKGKKRRKAVKIKTSMRKAGSVTLRLKKGRLKPGGYRLSMVATDAAGNRSKTIRRKLKVRTGK